MQIQLRGLLRSRPSCIPPILVVYGLQDGSQAAPEFQIAEVAPGCPGATFQFHGRADSGDPVDLIPAFSVQLPFQSLLFDEPAFPQQR